MSGHLTPTQIDTILLGIAAAAENRKWDDHLKDCSSCKDLLERHQALMDRFRGVSDVPEPPVEMQGRIERALRHSQTEAIVCGETTFLESVRNRRWAWTAVAVAMAFLGGIWLGRSIVRKESGGDSKATSVSMPANSVSSFEQSVPPAPSRAILPTPRPVVSKVGRAPLPWTFMEDTATQTTLDPVQSAAVQLHDRDERTLPTLGEDWSPCS